MGCQYILKVDGGGWRVLLRGNDIVLLCNHNYVKLLSILLTLFLNLINDFTIDIDETPTEHLAHYKEG